MSTKETCLRCQNSEAVATEFPDLKITFLE